MHDILVKPLPRGCRLTAMFDVSYINNIMQHEYTDDVSLDVSAVLPFWDRSGFVII
jgi:hypothetical protein